VTDDSTTLLLGGRIYTPAGPDATAMAVTGGTVVWVGQDAPARALHPSACEIRLDGAFVAAAFVDAHVHATATGLHLTGLDLTGVRGAAGLLAAARRCDHLHHTNMINHRPGQPPAEITRHPLARTGVQQRSTATAPDLTGQQ
jgi:predicted amidohydrolase YtcJ